MIFLSLCWLITCQCAVFLTYRLNPKYLRLVWPCMYIGWLMFIYQIPRSMNAVQYTLWIILGLWSARLLLYGIWRLWHNRHYAMRRPSIDQGGRASLRLMTTFVPLYAIFYGYPLSWDSAWVRVGGVLAVCALMIELCADSTLVLYKTKHPWGVLKKGMWAYGYPNYMAEILFWIGIFCVSYAASSSLYMYYSLFSGPVLTMLWCIGYRIPAVDAALCARRTLRIQ